MPGQHQVGAARLRSVGPLLTGPASHPRRLRSLFSATGSDRIDFKFYDLLEQILDKQPSTSASAAETDAIEISEDSDGDGANDLGKFD